MPMGNPTVHDALRRAVRVLHKSVLKQRTISLPNVIRIFRRRAGAGCDPALVERGGQWLRTFYRAQQPFRLAAWKIPREVA